MCSCYHLEAIACLALWKNNDCSDNYKVTATIIAQLWFVLFFNVDRTEISLTLKKKTEEESAGVENFTA